MNEIQGTCTWPVQSQRPYLVSYHSMLFTQGTYRWVPRCSWSTRLLIILDMTWLKKRRPIIADALKFDLIDTDSLQLTMNIKLKDAMRMLGL